MITIKSNIEYLTKRNMQEKALSVMLSPESKELITHIDYAIETLKMIDQLKDDAWDEKRADAVGANGNDGLHYEPH